MIAKITQFWFDNCILLDMILILKYIVPRGFIGISLYPFIFLKRSQLRENTVLINHERIHLKQQVEMLLVFFYLWYGIEYLIRLFQYKDRREAYLNISFEREAYVNETNLEYIKKRPNWAFLKYVK